MYAAEKGDAMREKSPHEGKLMKTWEVHAFDRDKNEFVSAVNHSYSHAAVEDEFTPAAPAKITPSRRKAIKRDYASIFVFSDLQIDYRRIIDHETQTSELIPLHDERAMKVARFICRDIRPDYIYNLGDSIDLAALSRFKPDSDHFHATIGPSFQRLHDYYAELRSDNPEAEIAEVDSNHNIRLKNFVLKNAAPLYNMHRPGDTDQYPVMSYPYLANLGHLGVKWYGGYGAAVIPHNYDDPNRPDKAMLFRHGTKALKGSTTSRVLTDSPEIHTFQGHIHRAESMWRTNRAGKYIGAHAVGSLCRIDGVVPSYYNGVDDTNLPVHYQENWQQSVAEVRDYGDGHYEVNHIFINDGHAFYNGKEYSADDLATTRQKKLLKTA